MTLRHTAQHQCSRLRACEPLFASGGGFAIARGALCKPDWGKTASTQGALTHQLLRTSTLFLYRSVC